MIFSTQDNGIKTIQAYVYDTSISQFSSMYFRQHCHCTNDTSLVLNNRIKKLIKNYITGTSRALV